MSEYIDVLEWHPVGTYPTEAGDYLLYNQCDGYHIVEAWFDGDEFTGFWPFAGTAPLDSDCYCAWSKLPNTCTTMFTRFAQLLPGDPFYELTDAGRTEADRMRAAMNGKLGGKAKAGEGE